MTATRNYFSGKAARALIGRGVRALVEFSGVATPAWLTEGGLRTALYFCSLIEYLHAMELGQKIKKVREAAGLNQKEAAERAGVDQGMLSKIENRGQNPSLEILRRIASGLGCSVVDLLPDDMRRPQRASPTKAPKSRGGRM